MAVPASTYGSYDAVGVREDLRDLIDRITPTRTPLQMMIGRGTATQKYHEFQTDALAAVDPNNACVEGDDASTDAATPTVRLGNYTQISDKVPRVTGSLEEMKKAGRRSELAYQMAKRSEELKRDVEAILCSNQASVAGDASTTARKLGGLRAWLTTNKSLGAGGSGGGFSAGIVATATDGTQRPFLESYLQDVSESCYNAGGEPTVLMVGTYNKRKVSKFTGTATPTRDVTGKRITATVSVYEDDFNVLRVTTNRFQRARDGLLLDLEHIELVWFRPWRYIELAVTGDSVRRQILGEYTLAVLNEASCGIVADLTTSAS